MLRTFRSAFPSYAALTLLLGSVALSAAESSSANVDFDRQVRPILSERCFTCHGPDEGARQANLRFDTEQGALAKLNDGNFAIVRGDSAKSMLLERITTDDPVKRMPPAYMGRDKLPEKEIAILRQWVAQGAPWSKHWSFVAPVRPAPPQVSQPEWVKNAIDNFVLARLDREEVKPSAEADRRTLLRRLSLDLTGLPPKPADVEAFVNDKSPNAYEKVVDRLLASPQFGEQMAIWWLDAARYSDTNGYQTDGVRTMWPWRDWVVDAFNHNQPFDQFTIEQIAGDLLPNATLDQKIATAFNRNHRTTAEGGSVEEEFLAEYAADRVATTSTVWLGVTMGCARCHDHKFDPWKQKEFYQLFAYFDNIPERGMVYNFGNDAPMIKAPNPEQQKKLAELDQQIATTKARLERNEPKIASGITKWSRKLAREQKPLDWILREDMQYRATLDAPAIQFVEPKKKEKPAATGKRDAVPPAPDAEDEAPGPRTIEVAEGRFKGAASLDEKSYVELGDIGGFSYDDPFTISFWINPQSADGAIVNRMEDAKDPQGLGLFLDKGKLRVELTMRYTDLSMRVVSKQPLAMNQWQHVAVTFTGELPSNAGTRIYVNGEKRDFDIEWDDLKWPIPYKAPFRIGKGGGRPGFTGKLDELRIYTRPLSVEEVGILSVAETLDQIAAIDPAKRSAAQSAKLRYAYLDMAAHINVRQSLAAWKQAQHERDTFYDAVPTVMVMKEREDRKPTFLLKRGAYDAPGEEVQPGVPAVLPALHSDWPNNRLGLARWIVDRENPLTARVTVNRFWQMLFGTGIVKTVDDFGSQGERPTHPELLDWLAVEFMDSGWNMKGILKTMVMSATYQQSSKARPELTERDPENRLLARGSRYRLPAETIRDQALAASGLLNKTMGGPPVKPYQPAGLWSELSTGDYERDSGGALYRRSLYTYWRRTMPPPSMSVFDAADRETCRVQRARTNTPLQALTLMNDVTFVEASRKLAERMITEGGASSQERIGYGFQLVTGRPPQSDELAVMDDALGKLRAAYGSDAAAASELLSEGESKPDAKLDPIETAAYAAVANLILNVDEAVTRE